MIPRLANSERLGATLRPTASTATQFIEVVARGIPPLPRTLVVAAHPDDETAGLGSRIGRFSDLTILHVTDGSPLDLRDARTNGFDSRQPYASARRMELKRALQCCGVKAAEALTLDVIDQRACFHLPDITIAIAHHILAFRPELILTHSYEGGHPDHDACAFAVHTAVEMTGLGQIGEFASYHAGAEGVVASDFLPGPEPVFTCHLTAGEREVKKRMMDAFFTQRTVLEMFSPDVERYRPAPAYDFTLPPHPGRLYYENFEWGVNGERFRELARRAVAEFRGENLQ
jgi:LmbE family N-acetylglucosaminyl deacetylase